MWYSCINNVLIFFQISPAVSKSTANYVHHLVGILCPNLNESHVGISQDCDDATNAAVALCRDTGTLFAAWAVGGTV